MNISLPCDKLWAESQCGRGRGKTGRKYYNRNAKKAAIRNSGEAESIPNTDKGAEQRASQERNRRRRSLCVRGRMEKQRREAPARMPSSAGGGSLPDPPEGHPGRPPVHLGGGSARPGQHAAPVTGRKAAQ